MRIAQDRAMTAAAIRNKLGQPIARRSCGEPATETSMKPAFFLRVAAGTLLLLQSMGLGTSALAEGRQWIALTDKDMVSLIYGTPETDDVLLNLSCTATTKTVTVWFAVEPSGTVKDPATMPMAFSSEGGDIKLTGNGKRLEMDDSYALEATTELTPEWEKLLSEAKTLSIAADDGTEDLAIDAAARKGLDAIVAACRK
jgi:hypothetical protein